MQSMVACKSGVFFLTPVLGLALALAGGFGAGCSDFPGSERTKPDDDSATAGPAATGVGEPNPLARHRVEQAHGQPRERGQQAGEPRAEGPAGCLYTTGIVPSLPAEPTNDSSRIWWDADGQPVQTQDRVASTYEGVPGWVATIREPDGLPRRRSTYFEGEHGARFESIETLYLEPAATLPNTYGMPATWSERHEYDGAGHPVRRDHDIAMDGLIDYADEWDWRPDGSIAEHRQYFQGELQSSEVYGPHGRIVWQGHEAGSGYRFTYDDGGLLVLIESLSAGQVVREQQWEERAVDEPAWMLEHAFLPNGEVVFLTESRWEYYPQGALAAFEMDRVVNGHLRHQRTEYTASGKETRMWERTEDPSCHVYDRITTYSEDESVVLSANTTCDGAPYDILVVDTDAAGRPIHSRRVYYGNAKGPQEEIATWEYDACGATVRTTRSWSGKLYQTTEYEWDSQGRLILEVNQAHDNEPTVSPWAYDDAGRVVQAGSRAYEYDEAGRLVWMHSDVAIVEFPLEDPAAYAISYQYAAHPK